MTSAPQRIVAQARRTAARNATPGIPSRRRDLKLLRHRWQARALVARLVVQAETHGGLAGLGRREADEDAHLTLINVDRFLGEGESLRLAGWVLDRFGVGLRAE